MASKLGDKWTSEPLRISLVGKTGCGKSSTGNTILGRKAFIAQAKGKSVTQICSKVESDVDGRRVALVDTPGLFDTSLANHVIIKETYKSVSLLAPGPHAILLLLQIGRFTKEEKDAVEYVKAAFGEEAHKYIMVLFTRGDDLEEDEKSIEDYIETSEDSLKSLILECGNRFHVFNNREKKDRTQVRELLQKIDNMVLRNGGRHYTSEMLQEAEKAIQEKQEKLLKEKEAEMKKKEDDIRRKYKQEIDQMMQKEQQRREQEKQQMEKALKQMDEKIKQEKELREKEQKEREKRERDMEREREREQREMEKEFEQQMKKQKLMHENMERQEREQRKREQREREQREREQREREDKYRKQIEEMRDKEIQNLKTAYMNDTRREAEHNNSFLDKVADAVVNGAALFGNAVCTGVKSILGWFGL